MTDPTYADSDRRSVYTGRATNWAVILTLAVMAIPLILLGGDPRQDAREWTVPLMLYVAGLALYILTGSSVRTTAGPNGVTVHFGALGWPRCTYRIDEIDRAEVIDLNPLYVAFGFWWTPGRTCCTVRSGPTLRLLLLNGRTVTITAPAPHEAVSAINDAKERPSR